VYGCLQSGRHAVATILDDFSGEWNMLMKKVLVSALFAAGMIGAVATPLPSVAADVFVNIAPPALRIEAVPEQRAGYVWAPGYWNYEHNNHVWVAGTSVREREGYVYQPHRWVEHEGKWNLEQGRWDRSHKRD
jgi:hypothetical protein